MIVGFMVLRCIRLYFGVLVFVVWEDDIWCYIGYVGIGFSYKVLEDFYVKFVKLMILKLFFFVKVKDEVVMIWVKFLLVVEVKFV